MKIGDQRQMIRRGARHCAVMRMKAFERSAGADPYAIECEDGPARGKCRRPWCFAEFGFKPSQRAAP